MSPLALIFWHETWLSLFLWTEILCLVAAGILHYVGQSSVRRNPDDYVYHFAKVWWTTFRQKPSPIRAPRMIDVDADETDKGPLMDLIDEEAIAELGRPAAEPSDDDDDSEATEQADADQVAGGMRVSTLTVRVIPQQSNDEVVGWQGRPSRSASPPPRKAARPTRPSSNSSPPPSASAPTRSSSNAATTKSRKPSPSPASPSPSWTSAFPPSPDRLTAPSFPV